MNATDADTFWDDLYAARPPAADPRPNVRLTEVVASLPPGDALDLGCGAGGDALWLAGRGWRVTAADLSAVAVERLAALARTRGARPHPRPGRARRRRPARPARILS
ncbi:class I SAM-dependent methyltransferase [Nonomuraea antri]|uniref:class I SAM-dependent methyltransferase n=1 Tax=Nonomuraea antri TaxID=2730852 RepID=UPI001C2C8C2F|nr:methyltransferase domain-containing protein [Nonomuraea antri]